MVRAGVACVLSVLAALWVGGFSSLAFAESSCPPSSAAARLNVIPEGAVDGSAKLVVSIARNSSSIDELLRRAAEVLHWAATECRIGDAPPTFGEIIVNFDPCGAADGCFQIVLDRVASELDAENLLFYGAFSGANHAGAAELVKWCDAGAAVHYRAFCDGATARFCRSPERDKRCH